MIHAANFVFCIRTIFVLLICSPITFIDAFVFFFYVILWFFVPALGLLSYNPHSSCLLHFSFSLFFNHSPIRYNLTSRNNSKNEVIFHAWGKTKIFMHHQKKKKCRSLHNVLLTSILICSRMYLPHPISFSKMLLSYTTSKMLLSYTTLILLCRNRIMIWTLWGPMHKPKIKS